MLDSWKMVEKQSELFHTFLWHFFPSLKQNFIAYRFLKCQIAFLKFTSCDNQAVPEIIKIGHTSHKMYRNNILNYQESTTILNVHTYAPHMCERVWARVNQVCVCLMVSFDFLGFMAYQPL